MNKANKPEEDIGDQFVSAERECKRILVLKKRIFGA